MGVGEIQNVDVVPDAGAVRRLVVRPVDFDRLLLTQRDFEHIGNKMRFDPVVLAEFLRSAGRVEIPQSGEAESVDLVIPPQDLLEHQLRLTVGIDRALRQRFIDRHALGNAERGAGGGKDEALHTIFHHGIEQVHAVGHVVAEILRRIGHRLADQRIGRKMHHGIRSEFLHGQTHRDTIGKIGLVKCGPRIHGRAMTFGQVVEDGDFMPPIEHFLDTNAPDVPRASRDQNLHGHRIPERTPAINKRSRSAEMRYPAR